MDVFMFFFFLSSVWAAQNPFRSEIAPVTLTNTNQGTMEVLIAIPKGYHLYKDMMSVQAVEPNGVTFQEPEMPKGLFQPDPANPTQYREHYEETIVINVPLAVHADGSFSPKIEVRYQGCKKGLCYKPAIDVHTVPVTKTTAPKPSHVPIPRVVEPLWRAFQLPFFRFSSQTPKQ